MDEKTLDAIEARADLGCDGHGRMGTLLIDLPDLLFCPCVEQTAVDVRQLLAEVRRLTEQVAKTEAWARDEQDKRHAAEDQRLEARQRRRAG